MPGKLILGIGNILLRDEGVGVRAIEALSAQALPAGTLALDGGTSGADLVDEIADRDRLIVIDAVKTDQPPGTILRFGPAELEAKADHMVSLHEFGLVETLTAARCLGCAPKEVVIFGVAPKDISPGLSLSAEIAALLPRLVELVLAEARR